MKRSSFPFEDTFIHCVGKEALLSLGIFLGVYDHFFPTRFLKLKAFVVADRLADTRCFFLQKVLCFSKVLGFG